MGNYKFRLSDMLPNAWFYKLRDMSKPRNTQTPNSHHHHHHHHPLHHPNFNSNKSFSLTTFDPPRKSLKKKWARRRTAVYVPSDPRKINPDANDVPPSILDQGFLSAPGNGNPSSASDIIINVDCPNLPPILTRPKTENNKEKENKNESCGSKLKNLPDDDDDDQKKTRSPARISVSRPGRVRINRKRRKKRDHAKELGKKDEEVVRFAIVKSSVDPEKDFRESMMEMIMEKKMKKSRELEDLLACYLSLNSDQYHDVIIRAFQHIWFNLDP